MLSLTPLALLALLPAFVAAQETSTGMEPYTVRNVSLLVDQARYKDRADATYRSVLDTINQNKRIRGEEFYLGSTITDPTLYPQNAEWTDARFKDTFSLGAPENNCKMFSTQPYGPSGFNLTNCTITRDYALDRGVAWRGHNLLWHSQRPDWLVNNKYTEEELRNDIIPNGAYGVLKGLGPNVVSWDVVNEPFTDTTFPGINETYCVMNATRWPSFQFDGMANSTVIFEDTTWIDAAFYAADAARKDLGAENIKLFLNDYNVGNGVKSQCAFKTIRRMLDAGVPIDGLGTQAHYSARVGVYPSKAEQHWNFDQLKALGLQGAITEMDVWLADNTTESQRYQAAIVGDTLDTCLYSSNCNEFIFWGTRDDQSWLLDFPNRGVASGTLFDKNGDKKLVYYEVLARLQRFADGDDEPCATSDGVEACVLDPNA